MKKIYIYTLTDPRDNLIKYVGKTNNLNRRYYQHIKGYSRGKISSWIKTLDKLELLPEIDILDECSEDNWEFVEQYWISQIKAWGFPLKNINPGGNNNDFEFYSKIHKNKVLSQETKDKISISLKGKKHSEEWKIRISNSCKGNKNRGVGFKHSDETKRRMSNSRMIKYEDICLLDKLLNQYNKKTKEFVKSYGSISSAHEYTNISRTAISNSVNGRSKSAGGFIWKWELNKNIINN